jgi:hypothetical protein
MIPGKKVQIRKTRTSDVTLMMAPVRQLHRCRALLFLTAAFTAE